MITAARVRLALWPLGAGAGFVALALVLTSNHEKNPIPTLGFGLVVGWSFVFSGLIAWSRRPENRFGAMMVAVGFTFLCGALAEANSSIPFTIGVAVNSLPVALFAHLLAAFPDDRLMGRASRIAVGTGYVIVLPLVLARLLFEPDPAMCKDCPANAFLIHADHGASRGIELTMTVLAVPAVSYLIYALYRRWRSATPPRRRVLTPVIAAGGIAFAFFLLTVLVDLFDHTAASVLDLIAIAAFTAVPLGFLAGLLRSRLTRSSVEELMVELADKPAELREALARALRDPSLELAYWLPERQVFVNTGGVAFPLPAEGGSRAATIVEHNGSPIAALVHDASVAEDAGLVEAVGAAAGLALENERLQAELRAQYSYLVTVIDTAPSLLVSLDLEGRITNFNPAVARATGLDDPEQIRGRCFWDVLISDEEREDVRERFHANPEHPASEYENAFTNVCGKELVIAWSGAPLRDANGVVRNIVAGGLDVTERKHQEEELRRSRARIVEAGDNERRQLERHLHDGAQQRLVSLSLALRLAQARLHSDPDASKELLQGASAELAHALEELRELARGIHPAVLNDRGLAAALESLAGRSPVPLELVRVPEERLPGPVEAAAYYVVSEALANVVKHAGATSVAVSVERRNGTAVVEVSDNGVGGADPARGSGLRGLADRVEALDGRLDVQSPSGGGTTLQAEIPCA
ncbi:MAG: PAS domain-containing sensor histidine kinase [Gaiellaceae bacterium]